MSEFKVVSLNVRGMHKKRFTVYEWLSAQRFDLILLQETYCTVEYSSKFKKGWAGDIFHSHSKSNHSSGVCILIKKKG